MKSLSLSLILVVVAAVMGIGWLITEIDFLTSDADPPRNDELAAYERTARDLALTLDALVDKQEFLTQWQQHSELRLTLGKVDDFPVPPELRADLEAGQALVLEAEGNVSIHYYLPRSVLIMSMVLPENLVLDDPFRPSLILTLLFYVGVAAAILLWLYPLVRRLIVLRNTAQAFGRGDLASRVVKGRFSYIGSIEDEFNHMADRIQSLIGDNKLLGQAVSHNLKTPLARLRFGLDALTEAGNETTREKYARRINRDLTEMESLVETLLQYARLDEANIQLQMQPMELNGFVAHLLADIDNPSITVTLQGTGTDLHLNTDPNYLAILFNNLMSNALIHAKSRIRVSVLASATTTSIVVEDDGTGIPIEEREAVLEPFRRGSNSAGSRGHGMGLAIVARLARWLGASLQIAESADLGGAAASLHINRQLNAV